MRRILVTGSTGKQGGAVARHLLGGGFRVRALTRNPAGAAARQLADLGAEVVGGDLTDVPSLLRALKGVDGVFSVQNYWEKGGGFSGEVRQGKNLADAAKQVGVAHFVQSTMAAAATFQGIEHFESKREIEAYIDRLGLPRTFLGTVYFMDNVLEPKLGGALTFPILSGSLGRDTPLQMVAVTDLGGVATAIFTDPARFVGTRVDVAGDRLTVPQMKAVYRRVTGDRPKAYWFPAPLTRLINREFAAQLRWHNTVGWTFGPEAALAVYPAMTTFESFLRRHGVRNL